MPAWPKNTTAAKIVSYGDFHAANWRHEHLTRITPPFAMPYGKELAGRIGQNAPCAKIRYAKHCSGQKPM
jgi:hypothetical protein